MQKINEDDQVLDNVLTTLICTPFNELKEVTVQYKKTYQKDLHEDLDDKLKGSLGELYKELGIIKICKYSNTERYTILYC